MLIWGLREPLCDVVSVHNRLDVVDDCLRSERLAHTAVPVGSVIDDASNVLRQCASGGNRVEQHLGQGFATI